MAKSEGTDSKEGFPASSPVPQALAERLLGFCASQSIFAAFELGIFDFLHASKHPKTAVEISEELSTDEDATTRLLDTLVSLELLNKEAIEGRGDVYWNTCTSDRFLVKTSPNSIKGIMPLLEKSYKLYGNLSWAVREGSNQWQRTYDGFFARLFFMVYNVYCYLSGATVDVFSLIYATRRGIMVFLEGLRGSCKPEAERLVTAFDLSPFSSMCDMGGGTGDVAYAASHIYPSMDITVLDLPAIVECAPSFRPSLAECPTRDRVQFLGGDFFQDKLPTADLYVLTRIVQSFDVDKIDEILAKVFDSLPSGGAILICEKVLDDNKTGPLLGNLSSLSMLVVGNKGSRERSGLEYRELLEKHRFVDVKIQRDVGTFLDAILARKP